MYITTYLYFICTDVTIAIIILLWVAPDFRITFENMQIFSKLLNMLNGRKFEPLHEKHNSVSDTNRAVQAQEEARGWKILIMRQEKLHYPCGENKKR